MGGDVNDVLGDHVLAGVPHQEGARGAAEDTRGAGVAPVSPRPQTAHAVTIMMLAGAGQTFDTAHRDTLEGRREPRNGGGHGDSSGAAARTARANAREAEHTVPGHASPSPRSPCWSASARSHSTSSGATAGESAQIQSASLPTSVYPTWSP